MHVALLSPAWPVDNSSNGIVTYVHHLRLALVARGHRVSIVTQALMTGHREPGVYLVRPHLLDRWPLRRKRRMLRREISWGERVAAAFEALHRIDPIDVIEMEESFGWCAAVGERVPVPLVVKLHGPAFLSLVEEEVKAESGLQKIADEGAALARMMYITSPSTDTLQQTLTRYRLDPSLARCVPNLIGNDVAFTPWRVERARAETLLFVGRFDQRKGGDTVVRAFAKLSDENPELQLVFVGPDRGVPAAEAASMLGFEAFCTRVLTPLQRQRVHYKGQLPRSAVFALREQAALTLVASRWENQPNTALEAMMQGCPVVSADAGGMRELIEHGITGTLFRAGDVDDLCAGVRAVLASPQRAATMAMLGQQRVTERHGVDRCVEQTLEVYRGAIDANKPAGMRRTAVTAQMPCGVSR